jgi:hypothetical protein
LSSKTAAENPCDRFAKVQYSSRVCSNNNAQWKPRLVSSTDLEAVRTRHPEREQSNIAADTDALVCDQSGTWPYSDATLLSGVSYATALTTQPSFHGYLRGELGA